MASIAERVKQIIVEQLGVDEAQVEDNASFVDDLGADSLDIVELVMAFEEAFELEIPDEDAEKIGTVKDAVEYIESGYFLLVLFSMYSTASFKMPRKSAPSKMPWNTSRRRPARSSRSGESESAAKSGSDGRRNVDAFGH